MKHILLILFIGITIHNFAQTNPLINNKVANVPAYSQSSRDSLTHLKEGDVILNLTTGCLNYYYQQKWLSICGNCEVAKPIIESKTFFQDGFVLSLKDKSESINYMILVKPSLPISKQSDGVYVFTKTQNHTTYKISILAKESCGESEVLHEDIVYEMNNACNNLDKVTDNRNQQSYNVVSIGSNCWLSENVSYHPEKDKNNANIFKDESGDIYYNWKYIKNNNVCPTGWHIPTVVEAQDFQINYPKLLDKSSFFQNNGAYSFDDNTVKVTDYMYFWAINPSNKNQPTLIMIYDKTVSILTDDSAIGIPARCVKDK